MSISRYSDKNSFGGYTDIIKLNSLFHIFIHSTDSGPFVVEFKEWKWLNYKTRFSFVSNENYESTVIEVFNRSYKFFKDSKNYEWSIQQKESKLSQVLELIKGLE